MELLMNGQRARTIHVCFYVLGTQKILDATVKNGPKAVTEAMLWTSGIYEGHIGIRLQGGGTWSYPGPARQDRYVLGDLTANQEINIEILINLPQSPGRTGENYIPLLMGNGE